MNRPQTGPPGKNSFPEQAAPNRATIPVSGSLARSWRRGGGGKGRHGSSIARNGESEQATARDETGIPHTPLRVLRLIRLFAFSSENLMALGWAPSEGRGRAARFMQLLTTIYVR